MRRDQPTTPFDVDADDLTQQFWGASKGWVSPEQQQVRRRAEPPPRTAAPQQRDDTTGSLRVIREGFAAFRPQTSPNVTGEVSRQRRHGEPRQVAPTPVPTRDRAGEPHREATLGELAAGRLHVEGWLEDDFSDRDRVVSRGDHHQHHDHHDDLDPEYDVPLTPAQPLAERLGLGAVDPLLFRAGALVLALILLVPVMLSLRPDRDDSLPGDVVEAPQSVVAGAAPAGATEQAPATTTAAAAATSATVATPATTAAAAPETTAQPATAIAPTETAADPTTSAAVADADADAGAAVDVAAERIVPACPQTYTAAAGDSWYRIADAAGVTPDALLAENNATTATVILPGDDICLPEGAAMPTPPTTAAPTTDAPTTSEPAPTTTAAPTTAAPTTTTAPVTTVAPVANLSRSEVQELIRRTWPEDEVETALEIARRESNFIATADNGWCCVGVFQIYWTVHRTWLDDFGITERSDLFDARKNIAAAYHMWQQSGWGPWGG